MDIPIDVLETLHKKLSIVILKTPSSENRNVLTEANIVIMKCIADKGLN